MNKEPTQAHRRYLPVDYRKQNVFVTRVKAPAKQNVLSYWDGGSRDYFTLHRAGKVNHVSASPFQGEAASVELQTGDVLVRTGVFCGKPATAEVVYVE